MKNYKTPKMNNNDRIGDLSLNFETNDIINKNLVTNKVILRSSERNFEMDLSDDVN